MTHWKFLKPQTVIRWHRAGFRAYWRWKSRSRGGRPKTPADIRQLIRDMSIANPLWGAPRIHGELVGQTTVAHGDEKAATVAGLEELSAQSCRRHCVDGFVRSPDDLVSAVVWISDLAAFPPRGSVAGSDRTPARPWIARQLTCSSLSLPQTRSVELASVSESEKTGRSVGFQMSLESFSYASCVFGVGEMAIALASA